MNSINNLQCVGTKATKTKNVKRCVTGVILNIYLLIVFHFFFCTATCELMLAPQTFIDLNRFLSCHD